MSSPVRNALSADSRPLHSEVEQEVVTVLEDLPDEMLSLILGSVPFKERCGLSLVSTRWWRLLQRPDRTHWRDMEFTLPSDLTIAHRPDRELLLAWLLVGGRASHTEKLTLLSEDVHHGGVMPWRIDLIFQAFPRLDSLSIDVRGHHVMLLVAPREIALRLPELTMLRIRNFFATIEQSSARELSRLTDLQVLWLDTPLAGMPGWVAQLRQLQDLHLTIEGPTTAMALTDAVSGLSQLTRLSYRICVSGQVVPWGRSLLPPSLARVELCTTGDEDEAWLRSVWASLAQLPALKHLDFDGQGAEMPLRGTQSCLGRLTTLRHLELHASDASISEWIGALSQLTELDLSSSRDLAHLPWGGIARLLSRLQKLDLRGTAFKGPEAGDFQLLAHLPDLRCITWDGRYSPQESAAVVEATEQFNAEYAACLDDGGVLEAVLQQPGGSC